MSNASLRLTAILGSVALVACGPEPVDPAGDDGNVELWLDPVPLRGTALGAGDVVRIEVRPLGEEEIRSFSTDDPSVLSVQDAEAVMVCEHFQLIGPCNHVSTGDMIVTVRGGSPGRTTLVVLGADGARVDALDVEVRAVASFRPVQHGPWRFAVGQESTFAAVPVDASGQEVWLGSEQLWTASPGDRLHVTSQHRRGARLELRAEGLTPGEGALVITAPDGAAESFPIVVE